MKLLSIIVPFHNSRHKADRLLETLGRLSDPRIEVVLIDDGSTDGTFEHLADRARAFTCSTRLLRQENKGPGGARNSALLEASGRYVWFVDSDDNIHLEAIDLLFELSQRNFDFIDFGLVATSVADLTGTMRIGAMNYPDGAHEVTLEDRIEFLRSFGKMVTKIFRRSFLIEAGFAFPEYCVYEDNAFFFKIPLMVKSFYRSDVVGYVHHQEHESATRSQGSKPPRFYDRLPTASYGLQITRDQKCSPQEQRLLEDRFTRISLIHSVAFIREADGDLRMILRVMRWYRDEARRLGIARNPLSLVSGSRAYRIWFGALWAASRLLPSQHLFFERLHLSVWGRPIEYPGKIVPAAF